MKKLLLALLLVPALAFSGPGHWYDADHPGHGIQINRDAGFGYAVTWYLYRKDGTTAFLAGEATCEDFPCVIPLVEPSAGFMGAGEFDLGEPVGMLELVPTESGDLDVTYDLIAWIPECAGIGPGGLVFQGCVGSFVMEKLAD